jgi:hypothetical protein
MCKRLQMSFQRTNATEESWAFRIPRQLLQALPTSCIRAVVPLVEMTVLIEMKAFGLS